MKAIVYMSNTGSTEHYAKLLGHELNIPVYSMDEAKRNVSVGADVIYLGWVMASSVKGYKEVANRYKVNAVCAVGMDRSRTTLKFLIEKVKI